MALKIIGAGYGRTGTKSLCTALNQLGFPCYHMEEVINTKKNKSHLDFWFEVANGEPWQQYEWEQVFANYTASVDFPGSCVWQELMKQYPDAKVILTGHPKGAEAWYKSAMATIYSTESMWQFKVLKFFTPFGRKFGALSSKLVWQRSLKGTMVAKDKAIAQYEAHLKEVKAKVPSDKLLDYSVSQGWDPLCEFLEVPVPDTEFPNVNDTIEFKQSLRKLTYGAYLILGFGAIVFIALIYGLLFIF